MVVHGYGGNRTATVEIGPPLHQLGYGLLFVDLGYVWGDRRYSGGGREAAEVAQALGWVEANAGVPAVLLGFSGGALASLTAVARGSRPAAIVADSGFLGFRNVVAFRAHVPRAVTNLLPVLYPLFSKGGAVVDLTRELDDRPFTVPALARLTGGRLWMLPGVAHTKPFDADRAVYVARVDDFLRSVLP